MRSWLTMSQWYTLDVEDKLTDLLKDIDVEKIGHIPQNFQKRRYID